MPAGSRECIFCFATSRLTNEHVLPAWISKIYVIDEGVSGLSWHQGEAEERYRYPISPLSRRARAVCKACNNGWMSTLEKRAKPLLAPMILGDIKPTELTLAEQKLLAMWATKTAVATQFVLPETSRSVSRRFRLGIQRGRSLPVGVAVWLGRHDPKEPTVLIHTESGLGLYHVDYPPEVDGTGRPTSKPFNTTLLIGSLFLHVSVFEGADYTPEFVREGAHAKTVPIWPTDSTVSWPSASPLTFLEVIELAGIIPRNVPGLREYMDKL